MPDGNLYAAPGGLQARVAADAHADARVTFIQKTYLHLAGSIFIFAVIEAALLQIPGIDRLVFAMGGVAWLGVLAAFMVVGWVADKWAQSEVSRGVQYAGLGLYIVAEAFLFLPLMYFATFYASPDVLPTAGIITLTMVAGLTAVVFTTGKDFSFLRPALTMGGFIAIGFIVCSILFGFGAGTWFSVAMIVFASGAILYSTSNVLHHYRTDQYVAAALSLFAAVALLFWYVLRLLMALSGRD